MAQQIEQLLQSNKVWQGSQWQRSHLDVHASGFEQLDQQLPNHGWPQGGITEVLYENHGIGELQLLLPALAKLSQQSRWIIWVAPPFMPNAPALQQHGVDISKVIIIRPEQCSDVIWTIEQALKSGSCGAVLGWLNGLDLKASRRLQLAAEQGDCLSYLFRPLQQQQQNSSASVRMALHPSKAPNHINYHLLKRRGGAPLYEQSIPRLN
ncbi:translesion DNA synthesis-associated protein ImuA [Agarivorans sp. MS3-6]|uniref:translesion DNA synthesis-associated protein ImuA n=1 Tax=Agarivorans sp. TSD2052 TaxID=2937286 RepID=UPI00200F523C|nr:translesion DNA synthesis-associated protein ImuA [Agarivorans sp. TSD2052]UPW16810.1 translesion DNA synthesis-associated protein ImuA [Agarivorans sp. TSD2052]